VKCYACGKTGTYVLGMPREKEKGGGEAHISEAQKGMLRQKLLKMEDPS
jgi:hypothetical protein